MTSSRIIVTTLIRSLAAASVSPLRALLRRRHSGKNGLPRNR